MRVSLLAGPSVAAVLAVALACHDTTGPKNGSVTVQVVITGIAQDTSLRYTLNVDGGSPKTLRALQELAVVNLSPGEHQFVLTGFAVNCSVAGTNPRSVEVTAGRALLLQFVLNCVPNVGHVRVITTASGAGVDPDGYTLVVNHEQRGTIGVVATSTVDVPVGNATIELMSVARNCTVSPPVRSIAISFGATVDAAFDVSCVAAGSLRVTTATSGTDVDPDGFVLMLTAPGFTAGEHLDVTASKTIAELAPGAYTVTLTEVAANCDPAGSYTRTVTVGEGAQATTSFDVTCAPVTQLAYASDVTGDTEIYTINNNGLGSTRLTTSPREDFWPAWSPDGQRIAFQSHRDGHAEVYVMNADGTNVVRLTHDQGSNGAPTWSPDGSRIAFTSDRDGHGQLYLMNADGSNQTRLMSNTSTDLLAAWSPDGEKIAFLTDRSGGSFNIYVLRVATGVVTRLTTTSANEGRPAWSPDGTAIAFSRPCDYYTTDCGLYTMRADGSGLTQVAVGDEPAWSPDGKRLAFTESVCDYYYYDCTRTIAIIKADGTGYVRLTSHNEFNPAWRR